MRRMGDFRPLSSPFALSARTLRRLRLRRERSAWTSRSVRLLREQRNDRLRRLRRVRVLRNHRSRRVRLACALSARTRRRLRLVCALGNGTLRTLRLLQVRRNCDSASLRRVRGQSARRLRSVLRWFVPNASRQLVLPPLARNGAPAPPPHGYALLGLGPWKLRKDLVNLKDLQALHEVILSRNDAVGWTHRTFTVAPFLA